MKCIILAAGYATRMYPLTEIFPGVVLSRVALHGRERLVMTKSGGFGKPSLLRDLKELADHRNRE